jgi:hypothetical protein
MARRKRPLTFVPAVLFLSTGVIALVGSLFYSSARPSSAQVIRPAVAEQVQAEPVAGPINLGSCVVPEK